MNKLGRHLDHITLLILPCVVLALGWLVAIQDNYAYTNISYSYSPKWAEGATFEKDNIMTNHFLEYVKERSNYNADNLKLFVDTDSIDYQFEIELKDFYIDQMYGEYHCLLYKNNRLDEFNGQLYLDFNDTLNKYT